MTIRYSLCITAAVALGFALLSWNVGVAVLMLAITPFAAVIGLRRPTTRRQRWTRRIALAVTVAPIYFLSIGPYLATYRAAYGLQSAPTWIATLTEKVYAPHYYLSDHPNTAFHYYRLNAPYERDWNHIGMGLRGLFFDAE